jgi:hypothetical protein
MLTEKVLFCLVVVPVLWVLYGVLLLTLTDLDRPSVALIMASMPLFAYVGIVVSDAGMVDLKDLRPYFMRLFPSARKRLAVLPETRKQLQADLRAFIKSIGKRIAFDIGPCDFPPSHDQVLHLVCRIQDPDWAIFTTPRSTWIGRRFARGRSGRSSRKKNPPDEAQDMQVQCRLTLHQKCRRIVFVPRYDPSDLLLRRLLITTAGR